MISTIPCNFCENSVMRYSAALTHMEYSLPETFVLDDIDKITDGIISQYLVFMCNDCEAIVKYTYKDLEKMERKRVSKNVIDMIARGEIMSSNLNAKNKILVYCGKCNGFDGSGSCLLETYKNCEIKRFPNEL